MDDAEQLKQSMCIVFSMNIIVTSSYQNLQEYCRQINEENYSLKEELENMQEMLNNLQQQMDSSENNAQTHTELMDEINNIEGELAKVTKELSSWSFDNI